MPLLKGKKNMGRNIAELERAGHPAKQSIAIAYKEVGEDSENTEETARIYDINQYMEIKGNPISKVGIFPYSGSQIDPNGEKGLEPNKIYNVYRPEEELNNLATLESFKLVPWIDEHEMLGYGEEGLTAPEKKGVYGTIGEDVYFDYPYLRANIKAFSKKLIENDKKDLSIGYRCEYDIQSGTFEGQRYDAIQRNIRGNHIALVKEGRTGPDVSVQDEFIFTLDTKEGITMPTTIEGPFEKETMDSPDEAQMPAEGEVADMQTGEATPTLSDVMGAIKELCVLMKGKSSADGEYSEAEMLDEKEIGETSKMESSDEKAEDEDLKKIKGETKKPGAAMDAKTLYKSFAREAVATKALAEKLSHHVGTFACDEMTLNEVAVYGARKLKELVGLQCKIGNELATVEGYLAGAKSNHASIKSRSAMDSAQKTSGLDAYIASLQGE